MLDVPNARADDALAVRHTYDFPRPAVTADVVVFTIRGGDLCVLLIRRGKAPFKGAWALPGGFVDQDEPLARAAARELEEETALTGISLEQLGAFGDPGRDPRGHTVSIAYYGFLAAQTPVVAGDDASAVDWHSVRALPKMAFDHASIVALAHERLRQRLEAGVFGGIEIVPPRFTLSELQHVHEAVLGRQLDKRNFRARLLARRIVAPALSPQGDPAQRTGRHRPAQLYRFASEEDNPSVQRARSRDKPARARKSASRIR
jgi:8-oxo-dGTP diphosphatase